MNGIELEIKTDVWLFKSRLLRYH